MMGEGEPLTIKILLNVPLDHGGETLTELVLTEPTFEQMEKVQRAPEADRGLQTIMAVTGLPPSVVKQLRGRDIRRINDEVPKLLGEADSLATGEI